jgi:hypothetical protein
MRGVAAAKLLISYSFSPSFVDYLPPLSPHAVRRYFTYAASQYTSFSQHYSFLNAFRSLIAVLPLAAIPLTGIAPLQQRYTLDDSFISRSLATHEKNFLVLRD